MEYKFYDSLHSIQYGIRQWLFPGFVGRLRIRGCEQWGCGYVRGSGQWVDEGKSHLKKILTFIKLIHILISIRLE